MSKQRIISSLLLLALLFTVAIAATGCTGNVQSQEAVGDDYVAIETEAAVADTIANTTSFNGRVLANEEIMVMPKLVGIVNSVKVKLGDKVTKDTILFTLDQEDILKSTQQAENGLNSARLNYELNKERIENAMLNLERTKKLFEAGAASKAQLEQAEMAASDKQLEAAQGQVKQAELSYEHAMSNLDNTVVRAPMDGVVSVLNVKEGQIAASGQVAAVIVDIERVYMQFSVVEGVINRLSVGQEVMVNIPAAFNDAVAATVDYVSPAADARSQLYPVKVYIDNPEQKIRPGMNGSAKLSIDKIDSAIVIKSNAVLDKNGEKIIFVVENDLAVERKVTIGLDTGDFVEIKSGLKAGEMVIVKGQHYVENGQKVKDVRGE